MLRPRNRSQLSRRCSSTGDGDAGNNGTGFGTPAKDLSINFVAVPYTDYPPAVITMRPEERQLWRLPAISDLFDLFSFDPRVTR